MFDARHKIEDYGFADFAPAGFYIAFRVEFLLPEFEHNTLPRPWVHKYTQQGLMMADPVMRWIYSNEGAARWSDFAEQDTGGVFEKAADYGLKFGAAISLHDNEISGLRSFGNFCREDREITDDEVQALQRQLELLFEDLSAPDDITDAEIETLKLLKAGLLIKEVAFEIGISEAAVKQRLRSAKDKLGARTTPHAVSVASEFGLI